MAPSWKAQVRGPSAGEGGGRADRARGLASRAVRSYTCDVHAPGRAVMLGQQLGDPHGDLPSGSVGSSGRAPGAQTALCTWDARPDGAPRAPTRWTCEHTSLLAGLGERHKEGTSCSLELNNVSGFNHFEDGQNLTDPWCKASRAGR